MKFMYCRDPPSLCCFGLSLDCIKFTFLSVDRCSATKLPAAKARGGEGSPIPWEVVLDLLLCPHGSLEQACLELLPVGSCSAAPQCICSCRWNFFVSSPQIAAGLSKGEVEHKQDDQNTKYCLRSYLIGSPELEKKHYMLICFAFCDAFCVLVVLLAVPPWLQHLSGMGRSISKN